MNNPIRSRWLVLLLLAVLGSALLTLSACGADDHAGEASKYHCPMHPTYISDKPGDCPICGMRLVPMGEVDSGQSRIGSSSAHPEIEIAEGAFLCPMHPEIGSDDPEDRCPKCGMRLEPRDEVLPKIGTAAAHEGHGAGSVGVEGMAPVDVTPEGARLAGIQTAPVEPGSLGRAVRTVGTVVPDETRVRHVHTKISGFIERLHVNFTGQEVRRGQPILAIYSPELVATQEEFLRAKATAERFASSSLPEVRRGGEDLVKAARRRLELFDVPRAFVDELERTGQVRREVTLFAPVSGFVTAKDAFEGQQVSPGMELFTITDLSKVWIEADFYEYEAPALALGQEATLTLPYDPATELEGRIAYVYPTLDEESRTLRVRFEFPNPNTALKPGMFANVELATGRAEGLVIPDSAVLDTGERQVVFVETSPGRFEPREITVGTRSAGTAEVLSGLVEGDRVVVKANFLLDSESRMRSAFSSSNGSTNPPAAAPEHQH